MKKQEIFYKLVGKEYQSALAKGKYCKIYLPDTIVESEPDSLGCMLFSSYEYAKLFYKTIVIYTDINPFKMLAVNGIGPKIIPKAVSSGTSEYCINEFYDHGLYLFSKDPVKGTVCFRSVKVLYQIGPSLGLERIKV